MSAPEWRVGECNQLVNVWACGFVGNFFERERLKKLPAPGLGLLSGCTDFNTKMSVMEQGVKLCPSVILQKGRPATDALQAAQRSAQLLAEAHQVSSSGNNCRVIKAEIITKMVISFQSPGRPWSFDGWLFLWTDLLSIF